MGAILVRKLVKQTKVVCSWAPHQGRFGQMGNFVDPDQ